MNGTVLAIVAVGSALAGCGSPAMVPDAAAPPPRPRIDASVPAPPTPVGEAITRVIVHSTGTTDLTNVPVTFAQPFRAGDVPASHYIVARAGTEGLPTQLDAKARHADGSLRHGVITVLVPSLAAGSRREIELVASTAPGASGDALSIDALLASGFNASVAFETSTGSTIASFARSDDMWLSGPLVSEWTSVSDVTVDGRPLSVRFDVRWLLDGRARVGVTVENAWASRAAGAMCSTAPASSWAAQACGRGAVSRTMPSHAGIACSTGAIPSRPSLGPAYEQPDRFGRPLG